MKKIILILLVISAGCTSQTQQQEPVITDLADEYLERTISRFPEDRYFLDLPIQDHSLFSSNHLQDLAKWEKFEDSLYTELIKIDKSKFSFQADQITYWLLMEELESSIGMRACKRELWNVNHQWNFSHLWLSIVDFQPVGNDTLREQALRRWKKFPKYVDTEIENLKVGIEKGYSMPKEIVELVIPQIEVLTSYSLDDSPFMSPAKRDSSEIFQKEWEKLVIEQINPALSKYAEYLQSDYLEKARTEGSVLALPNGNDCYKAFIRSSTTTKKSGEEIFDLGLEIVNSNSKTIQELGKDLYQLDDFAEIISRIDTDSSLYFKSSDEILAYNNAILDSAKAECEDWFDLMPSSDVTIKPYLPHEYGSGSYESGTENKPAYFRINLKDPKQQTYFDNEKLSFHEAYPGHHLQLGIERDIDGLHPIRELLGFQSYMEGWARYAEQLAEEMGLYNHKASLINRRAWPSRGMVIDPALHLNIWPKDSIINFMMASGMSQSSANGLYRRSIVYPAQLTSYDVGGEEIKALRKLSEERLMESFDIKEFHNKVLENGSIPLSALRIQVEQWIDNKLTSTNAKNEYAN